MVATAVTGTMFGTCSVKTIFSNLKFSFRPKQILLFRNPLTCGPISHNKHTQLWTYLLWKISGFHYLSMLLDSSESNIVRPQLIVGISIPATHYPFLPDQFLSLLIYLKLTWEIRWFLWVCLLLPKPVTA